MTNPLEQAQKSGVHMNDKIGSLFDMIGNNDHPRGVVTTAYRNARRAMASALQETDRVRAAREVMSQLRRDVRSGVMSVFADAQNLGTDESARQLRFYGIKAGSGLASVNLSTELHSAVDAVTASVDNQQAAVIALLATGADDAEIIGDENRVGLLAPAPTVSSSTFWGAALVWDAFDFLTNLADTTNQFQKQAVAALDMRTTDCCLQVHGQIQPLDGLFHLTGTPRFADYLDWSPFHWNCRTSCVLYKSEYDEGLTDKMRAGADYILGERAAGRNPDQWPVDAFFN